ncbi:hypothetical protein DSO57_1037039 [Entomophthora muscae]|uniref:Uncharacterized protein n=1 Tax=Entomophthora muscae TaxID=34485 RepID=A0ACC2TLI9_9FUNG|nr:hypothetical protein DSO57_1037039 [Entomophthora muscae]
MEESGLAQLQVPRNRTTASSRLFLRRICNSTQIIKGCELFPSVFIQDLSDLVAFYASDSDKSRKDSCLPPRPFIHFVKPTCVTKEEFEQLKQSALAALSQSTNSASPTPHQTTCLPTLTPKPLPTPHYLCCCPFYRRR